ncbi:MAG: hypothetical protein ACYSUI_12370 [Planctomycetota bacterium]|jgi:hypothetical protein
MAVDRVEKRLRRVTAALDAAGIRYAVIGGNAVASWVGRVDPSATRATRDVGILIQRADLDRLTQAMDGLGFARHDLRRLVVFVDPDEPSRRAGVHLVWADEPVRPSYLHPAPSVDEAVRDPEGFWLLDLPALVRMKLTSNRDIDRAHVADLLSVGLIDEPLRTGLPRDLQERLATVERTLEE